MKKYRILLEFNVQIEDLVKVEREQQAEETRRELVALQQKRLARVEELRKQEKLNQKGS